MAKAPPTSASSAGITRSSYTPKVSHALCCERKTTHCNHDYASRAQDLVLKEPALSMRLGWRGYVCEVGESVNEWVLLVVNAHSLWNEGGVFIFTLSGADLSTRQLRPLHKQKTNVKVGGRVRKNVGLPEGNVHIDS